MRMCAAVVAAVTLYGSAGAWAAEIRVFASNALKTSLEELAPQFEKASEHKLAITYGASARLQPAIEKGEPHGPRRSDQGSIRTIQGQ